MPISSVLKTKITKYAKKKKYTDLGVPQLKITKVFLGIFLGLVILWIIVLSMMYYNGKSLLPLLAVAVATLILILLIF